MSHKATDWAWEAPVRGVRQHVLFAIAERTNRNTGRATPSLAELSARTGLGQSTIRGHIRALEAAGLLKVEVTNGGRRQRSTYIPMLHLQFSKASETPQELGGRTTKTRQQRGQWESARRPVSIAQ